jgi:hypothetical protein
MRTPRHVVGVVEPLDQPQRRGLPNLRRLSIQLIHLNLPAYLLHVFRLQRRVALLRLQLDWVVVEEQDGEFRRNAVPSLQPPHVLRSPLLSLFVKAVAPNPDNHGDR